MSVNEVYWSRVFMAAALPGVNPHALDAVSNSRNLILYRSTNTFV